MSVYTFDELDSIRHNPIPSYLFGSDTRNVFKMTASVSTNIMSTDELHDISEIRSILYKNGHNLGYLNLSDPNLPLSEDIIRYLVLVERANILKNEYLQGYTDNIVHYNHRKGEALAVKSGIEASLDTKLQLSDSIDSDYVSSVLPSEVTNPIYLPNSVYVELVAMLEKAPSSDQYRDIFFRDTWGYTLYKAYAIVKNTNHMLTKELKIRQHMVVSECEYNMFTICSDIRKHIYKFESGKNSQK